MIKKVLTFGEPFIWLAILWFAWIETKSMAVTFILTFRPRHPQMQETWRTLYAKLNGHGRGR